MYACLPACRFVCMPCLPAGFHLAVRTLSSREDKTLWNKIAPVVHEQESSRSVACASSKPSSKALDIDTLTKTLMFSLLPIFSSAPAFAFMAGPGTTKVSLPVVPLHGSMRTCSKWHCMQRYCPHGMSTIALHMPHACLHFSAHMHDFVPAKVRAPVLTSLFACTDQHAGCPLYDACMC